VWTLHPGLPCCDEQPFLRNGERAPSSGADNESVGSVPVECLSCGYQRLVDDAQGGLGRGACPRCGYVGWAYSSALSEDERRALRDVPVARRSPHAPDFPLAA
jgi:hypothetical protein